MAAGLGFKTFTTGEVLTAADVNGYLMQGILVFANAAARSSAITSPQEGQYSFLKDTNALEYYDGAAWVGAPVGDITSVTAGTGISGGGSSGDVTITNSMATAIDAKGDLIAGTADNTFSRLAVGNSGEIIVADSSTSTGLRYNPQNALANPIINGGLDIWQRGTSFTCAANTATYTADRWLAYRNVSGLTVSRQNVSDSTNLPTIQYAVRVQRDSGNTSTVDQSIRYSVETANSIPFAGRTITFSFYARAGANYSSSSSALNVLVQTGTGTDQNIYNGYTGVSSIINTTVTLTTSWQRFALTATVPSTATEFGFVFYNFPVGTAGANDWFEVTGVQFDLGTYTASTAPAFRRSGGTLVGELAGCRRYLPMVSATNSEVATGYSYSTNNAIYHFYFDVPARVAPTGITLSGNFNGYALNTSYAITPVFNGSSQYGATLVSGSGMTITAGQGSRLATNGTSTILFTGCEL